MIASKQRISMIPFGKEFFNILPTEDAESSLSKMVDLALAKLLLFVKEPAKVMQEGMLYHFTSVCACLNLGVKPQL